MIRNSLLILCSITLVGSLIAMNPVGVAMMAFIIGIECRERMSSKVHKTLTRKVI